MISRLGAQTAATNLTTMQLEFPLLVYASAFNHSYAQNVTNYGQTCNTFYTQVLNFGQANADGLCNDPSNTFNWSTKPGEGYFQTALALLTIYFYEYKIDIANAGYFHKFSELSGYTGFQIVQNLNDPTKLTHWLVKN